ncbi:MAG: hypothetical protein ACQETA_05190, partial [Bacteroidota bacterium]
NEAGTKISVIRAGKANMFLSPLFCRLVADLTGASVLLYNTDGSIGAARGAGVGCGYYKNHKEAFASLKQLDAIHPEASRTDIYNDLYNKWIEKLKLIIASPRTLRDSANSP